MSCDEFARTFCPDLLKFPLCIFDKSAHVGYCGEYGRYNSRNTPIVPLQGSIVLSNVGTDRVMKSMILRTASIVESRPSKVGCDSHPHRPRSARSTSSMSVWEVQSSPGGQVSITNATSSAALLPAATLRDSTMHQESCCGHSS
jgi:hypothetical protein